MQIRLSCSCGSEFAAPGRLAGQTIACPTCGQPLKVPGTPAAESSGVRDAAVGSAGGSTAGSSMGTALGGSAMGGSTMGGTSAGRRVKKARTDPGIEQAKLLLCPKCKAVATDGGRLCERCAFEMYTGKRAGATGKFKLTLGLVGAVGMVIVGVASGLYFASGSDQDQTQAARDQAAADATPAVQTPRTQQPDPSNTWFESRASQMSGVLLRQAEAQAWWNPDAGEQAFTVRLAAEGGGDRRLDMKSSVTLYRGESADGPMTQVDHTAVTRVDRESRSLVFDVLDRTVLGANRNQLFYRLSAHDGEGRRLFDTPVMAMGVLPPPRVEAGRVKWTPQGKGPLPVAQCLFYIDAPGWENVVVERLELTGPLDRPVPEVAPGVAVRGVLVSPMPVRIDMRSVSPTWRSEPMLYPVAGEDDQPSGADEVVGVVPAWSGEAMEYRLLPTADQFTAVEVTPTAQGVAVRFSPPAASRTVELGVPEAPGPVVFTATPYADAVRLTWDAAPLRATLSRYKQPVALAIFRVTDGGPRQLVEVAGPDAAGWTDTTVEPGRTYAYELEVTQAQTPGTPPLLAASAWVADRGEIPVMIPAAPRHATPGVSPDPRLSAYVVALDPPKLVYPYTGVPAIELRRELVARLGTMPGVVLLDRGPMHRLARQPEPEADDRRGRRSRDRDAEPEPSASGPPPTALGYPAHLRLTVLDAQGPGGERLELWASDSVTGASFRVAATPAGQLDARAIADAAAALIQHRLVPDLQAPARSGRPSRLVIGPLFPVDQPRPWLDQHRIIEDLADRARRAGGALAVESWDAYASGSGAGSPPAREGAVVITGRLWHADALQPRLLLWAVDAATGEHLGELMVDRPDDTGLEQAARWAVQLPAAGLDPRALGPSALLDTEHAHPPLHPVWRELAGTEPTLDTDRRRDDRDTAVSSSAVSFALGLPLPPELRPIEPPGHRDPTDPLAEVRPYTAPAYPAMFDQWVAAYTRYIENDFKAFQQGIEQINRAARGSRDPVIPRFVVRGRVHDVESGTLAGVSFSPDPVNLNIRGFTLGAQREPVFTYRGELSEHFRTRPYAAMYAWKDAPKAVSEAFLKAELFGVDERGFAQPQDVLQAPPSLDRYVASKLLSSLGSAPAAAYWRQARQLAMDTVQHLTRNRPAALSGQELEHATHALLILLAEDHPAAERIVEDPDLSRRYFAPPPETTADTLRMLVDRIGPAAWDWVRGREGMDWAAFTWRSSDEMRQVLTRMPADLPEPVVGVLERWVNGDRSFAQADQRPRD